MKVHSWANDLFLWGDVELPRLMTPEGIPFWTRFMMLTGNACLGNSFGSSIELNIYSGTVQNSLCQVDPPTKGNVQLYTNMHVYNIYIIYIIYIIIYIYILYNIIYIYII